MLSKFNLIKKWFDEYFRRCPSKIQFRENDPPLLIIGHRGAPYKKPENTIPSFEEALKDGANALEIDLSLTRDNHVILWHDWDPNEKNALLREAGFEPWVKYKPHPPALLTEFRKPVTQLSLSEIRDNFDYKKRKGKLHLRAFAHIPDLEEFFVWAAKKRQLLYVFFDIKTPAEEKECSVEILNSIKRFQQKYSTTFNVVIETTYIECLDEMKRAHPDFLYSLDIEPPAGLVLNPETYSSLDPAIEHNNKAAVALRPRKITIANWTTYRRIIERDMMKLRGMRDMNEDDILLVSATVNKNPELRCLVRLGVDGVQTDFPGRLARIAKKYKRRIARPVLTSKVAV